MTEDEADLFYAEVGQRVADLRADRFLTQAEVANSCGLSRSSIANLEAGRHRVPAHSLVAIARLFDTPLADLTGAAESRVDRAPEALDLIRRQGQEIARLKGIIKDARRSLGDTCI